MKKLLALLCAVYMLSSAAIASAQTIVIEGSTTVLPIAQAGAEAFMKKNPNVDISVRGGGSGVGISSMMEGRCDIGDASRPMKTKEIKKAIENGIDPKPHVVAMDGIAVVVHPSNSIQNILKDDLKAIYTGKISDWSQVGGSGGKIVVISRDTASGTFEAFNHLALDKERVRPDALLQASNKAVATSVANTPAGIGYIGMGYLTPDVKDVTVDGVKPTQETVINGKYALSRPLYMYTNGAPEGVVAEFLNFILSAEGQKLAENQGFVPLK